MLAFHALSQRLELGKSQQAQKIFRYNPFKNEFVRAYANIYPQSSSECISRVFHREGHCFTPHFLKRLQQSTKAPAIKPSPGPACSQQGVAAQQEALPGYCSPTCTLHLVLQSGEGWAEYLLFFLLLQKNPHRFTGKKTPKSQKSNFNYLIYNYIQPFNC